MQPIIVTLAGRVYEVKPLPRLKARAFRQRLADEIGEVASALTQAGSAGGTAITDLESIGELISTLGVTVAGSIDLVADLLFDYSPELAADRERIESEGYDDELVAAFLEVLKLLYPFGDLLKNFQNGR